MTGDLQPISRACQRCRAPFKPQRSHERTCRRCRDCPEPLRLRTVAEAIGDDQVARILEAVAS